MTGVLPIALDRATRIVQVLLNSGKEYVCLMHLHKELEEEKIKEAFQKFSGEITQLPPIRSAVKRQERKRNVYYVDILEIEGKDILFRIGCQAGLYVRKYVHDLSKFLCCGCHMQQLVRSKAGPFNDKSMYTLHDLKDAYEFYKEENLLEKASGKEEEIRKIILPFENAADHLGKIWVLDGAVDPLCHGADLYVAGVVKFEESIKKGDLIAIFTLKNELICIGSAEMDSEELLKNEKGTAVKTTKVFMERGSYSKK